MNKTQAKHIFEQLKILIDNPKTELHYSSSYELLVAVILSAQCTDKRVNEVTKKLFAVANTPQAMVKLSQEELQNLIFSTGFYHNKAKNILACSKSILEKHHGQVPDTFSQLTALPGVGRKTANVVLSVAFSVPAIAVDTHVFRVANRLGLTHAKTPLETEKQLQALFDPQDWGTLHHLLILFGRYWCKAGNKNCNAQTLEEWVKNKQLSKNNDEVEHKN